VTHFEAGWVNYLQHAWQQRGRGETAEILARAKEIASCQRAMTIEVGQLPNVDFAAGD
jgi:hypothetical protein